MEIKKNEATTNRPEGDRIIDAPFVIADLSDFVKQLQHEKAWKNNDRNGITLFKSRNITIVLTALKAGASINENEVEGYLTIQVLKGKAVFSATTGNVDLSENQLITLHPHLVHSFRAIEDTIVLLSAFSL